MSDKERSIIVYEHWRAASEKFDYFVLGATGALCAFVAQSLKPEQLAVSPATLELVSLLVLIASAVCGFLRTEAAIRNAMANHIGLHHHEIAAMYRDAARSGGQQLTVHTTGEEITPEDALKRSANEAEISRLAGLDSRRLGDRAQALYRWRNRLLITGVLLLLAARCWWPYYSA